MRGTVYWFNCYRTLYSWDKPEEQIECIKVGRTTKRDPLTRVTNYCWKNRLRYVRYTLSSFDTDYPEHIEAEFKRILRRMGLENGGGWYPTEVFYLGSVDYIAADAELRDYLKKIWSVRR